MLVKAEYLGRVWRRQIIEWNRWKESFLLYQNTALLAESFSAGGLNP